jgi:Zn-finger nucleic acid-binding protein
MRKLVMTDRQGIEIDYCPYCRGVWFDKGELDKIIERSGHVQYGDKNQSDYYDCQDDDYHTKHPNYPRKKCGFLGDFFDFD